MRVLRLTASAVATRGVYRLQRSPNLEEIKQGRHRLAAGGEFQQQGAVACSDDKLSSPNADKSEKSSFEASGNGSSSSLQVVAARDNVQTANNSTASPSSSVAQSTISDSVRRSSYSPGSQFALQAHIDAEGALLRRSVDSSGSESIPVADDAAGTNQSVSAGSQSHASITFGDLNEGDLDYSLDDDDL